MSKMSITEIILNTYSPPKIVLQASINWALHTKADAKQMEDAAVAKEAVYGVGNVYTEDVNKVGIGGRGTIPY